MNRRLKGTVVSNKMKDTCVVEVGRTKVHPLYRKRYNVSEKFMVHDEGNTQKIGDKVEIEETRPLSKNKRWILASDKKRKK